MAKTATVRARIEPRLKSEAERITERTVEGSQCIEHTYEDSPTGTMIRPLSDCLGWLIPRDAGRCSPEGRTSTSHPILAETG